MLRFVLLWTCITVAATLLVLMTQLVFSIEPAPARGRLHPDMLLWLTFFVASVVPFEPLRHWSVMQPHWLRIPLPWLLGLQRVVPILITFCVIPVRVERAGPA